MVCFFYVIKGLKGYKHNRMNIRGDYMKKVFWITGLLLLSFFLVACKDKEILLDITEEQESADEQIENDPEVQVLQVGAMDYPPFEYVEDGELKGPYIDIVKLALDRLNYPYEVKDYSWNRLLEYAETGEVDVLIDVFDLPSRRGFLTYTEDPIGYYAQSIVKLKNDEMIAFTGKLEELEGLNVGLVNGYSYGNEIDEAIRNEVINVDYAPFSEGNFEKLLQGRVDVIIEQTVYALDYIKTHNIEDAVEILEPDVGLSYSYVAFSKKNDLEKLRRELDQEIKEMKADGTIAQIYSDYNLSYISEQLAKHEELHPPRELYFPEQDRKIFTIGALNNTPPYIWKENGEFKGLYAELIDEVFNRMGFEYELQDYSFTRLLEALKVGKLDLAVDVFVKKEREAYAYFPIEYPIAAYPYSLFKKKDLNFEFKGKPEELLPYRIGVIRGYSLGNFDSILNDDRYEIIVSNDPEENMEKLINDRADLVIDVLSTGESVVEGKDIASEIDTVFPPINTNYSYLVFSKENKLDKLMIEFESAMQSMIDDGTMKNLYQKYDISLPDKLHE